VLYEQRTLLNMYLVLVRIFLFKILVENIEVFSPIGSDLTLATVVDMEEHWLLFLLELTPPKLATLRLCAWIFDRWKQN
jgi:hypothetical protein